MTGPTEPHVFTIPPGAPFLPTLVDALLDGRLVDGFGRADGPLALAGVTIYVPTRRSARALAATIAERMQTATFLPRILPLGSLDALEPGLIFDEPADAAAGEADLPAAVDPLARRMILTRLILQWSRSVGQAIRSVDEDGRRQHHDEALLVGTTPADAWYLSGELAGLLDELAIEGVSWSAIEPLGTETFDRFWAITLDFLNVAVRQWPAILAERGETDAVERQSRLIELEIARLGRDAGQTGPVIVAGSTGSNVATARLIEAVARLPRGAVVLPGLDQGLDDAAWVEIGVTNGPHGSAAGHAQATLYRLLSIIGVARHDVVPIGSVPRPLSERARLVGEALRPAESTDGWHRIAGGASAIEMAAALGGVTLIEADDEGEEALALAVAMRETLEGERSAVLVTPDRTLARRVQEELARWGIEVDDSGGQSLAQSGAGALARLVLRYVAGGLQPVDLLALLAHPAVRLGRPRTEVDRLRRSLEIVLLRGVVPSGGLSDFAKLTEAATVRAAGPHASAALRMLAADMEAVGRLMADLDDALGALLTHRAGVLLPEWVADHEDAVAALARTEDDDTTLKGPEGTTLAALFDGLVTAADPAITLDGPGYAALFDRIAAEAPVRGPARSHPRLKILGLLEARLLSADRILLGGLDEAVWPPQVRTDAFLNRPMRAALGLSPPEWRIGQTAHDFTMALGQPEVIISRAAKRGGGPTVASRFLQRLETVAGPHWAACRERGARTLHLARRLDTPTRLRRIGRPDPKPPVALRPTRLSVTRVETLRRDPYAIHAERILRLQPLDPIGAALGPREWGTAFHGLLSDFVGRHPTGAIPAEALDRLLHEMEEAFAEAMREPEFRALMAPRIERWSRAYVDWEQGRRDGLAAIHVEAKGELVLTLGDGSRFTLTAHADRIETDRSGAVRIVDFKTGGVPSRSEVKVGFAPQLTLEAAMATRGAFEGLAPGEAVAGALYVKFGNGPSVEQIALEWKDAAFPDVVTDHLDGLHVLLNEFRDPERGYMARPFPKFASRFGDYDHLSRVKEWSSNAGGEDGDA